ncbi:hypothetical protein R84B8_00219 [Treponema sp. R8-4-B8]
MEIYFNPYPGAAKTEEEGLCLAVGTADALSRLKKEFSGVTLYGNTFESESDLPPSKFVLVRKQGISFSIGSLMFKTGNVEREKLRSLLDLFSKGRILDNDELLKADDWIVSIINAPAPILELAAKNKAIALTIPTESEWRINLFSFNDRTETLHNLWGQNDITAIISHCIEQIKNIPEQFSTQFNAKFCGSALSSAPDYALWERIGFFKKMEDARNFGYIPFHNLLQYLQGIEKTKFGPLLELTSNGYRIFFVYRKGLSPEILVGGFYKKGVGNNSKAQNQAIINARNNISEYSGE